MPVKSWTPGQPDPIGRIPNDPEDGDYLCPSDMILGQGTSKVYQRPFNDTRQELFAWV